jgi:sterol desaturase/sphingolipid hydroxylase (fatty acid hydroxylase superfamily)
MAHVEINHSKESIRLFKSDFFEWFTHISPVTIGVIWIPVAAIFLAIAIRDRAAFGPALASQLMIVVFFLIAAFFWTFAEYTLHRFLFHMPPATKWMERLSFLMHGVHHAQPQDKTRLVMPPPVSIPLFFVFYGLFWLVFAVIFGAPHWVAPFTSGFITGYVIYDFTHYATHHIPMRPRYLRFLKRYHMYHHTRTPEQRYGVSSPLWDLVFRTYPDEAKGK